MWRIFKIYSAYFARFVQARLAYKGDFIAELFATMVVTLTGLLYILLLLDGETITSLRGWSRDEVLFVYGYSLMPTALFNLLGPNLYQFGDKYIIQGQFDRVLLRPLSSLAQVLCESFNLESIANLVVGIAVLLWSSHHVGIHFGFLDYVWILISTISGAVILLSVFILLSSLSFHFEDRVGVAPPFYNLIMFGRYPVTIFNSVLQFILSWVVPFAFIAFYPSTRFLGRDGFMGYCYATPLVALVCFGIANFFWGFGVKRYASAGN